LDGRTKVNNGTGEGGRKKDEATTEMEGAGGGDAR